MHATKIFLVQALAQINDVFVCAIYSKFPLPEPEGMAEWIAHPPEVREVRGSGTGDGPSTLTLKPMNGVNQSPKQRILVAPQNGDMSPQK